MHEVLEHLNKVGVIEEGRCKSILREPNSRKRFKKFGDAVLESGKEGFEGFLVALRNAQTSCKLLDLVSYSFNKASWLH